MQSLGCLTACSMSKFTRSFGVGNFAAFSLLNKRPAAVFASRTGRSEEQPLTSLADDAWGLRHNITFSDACYVVLAQRLGGPLLTTDRKLAAAPTLPVRVLTP